MSLKTSFAALGALVSALLIALIFFAVGGGWHAMWITLVVAAALVLIGYIVAAVTVTNSFGEAMRGALIGVNAMLNMLTGFLIVAHIAGTAGGIIFALAIGALNAIAVIEQVSKSGIYQGIIGYGNWLMPMSWPIMAIGLFFYVLSFLLHAVTGGKVEYLKVQDAAVDETTGTLFIKGGLIANLNYLDTAFNMGNFSFVDYKSGDWHKNHEAGHTLNLAVFGAVFHLIGAIDENIIRGASAYSERLAESNSSSGAGNIPMWG